MRRLLVATMIGLAGACGCMAQQGSYDLRPDRLPIDRQAADEYLYNDVRVVLPGRRVEEALLLGLNGDSLVYQVGPVRKSVPISSIEGLELTRFRTLSEPTAAALAIGMYVGPLVVSVVDDDSRFPVVSGIVDPIVLPVSIAGFGIASWAFIGVLGRPTGDPRDTIVLLPGNDAREVEEVALRRVIVGGRPPRPWQLSLFGAYVLGNNASDEAMERLRELGWTRGGFRDDAYGATNDFNTFRRIQLTRTDGELLELGGALSSLVETPVAARWDSSASVEYIVQATSGVAVHAIGAARIGGRDGDRIDGVSLAMTVGIGGASYQVERYPTPYYSSTPAGPVASESGFAFSAFAALSVDLRVSDAASLGIGIDYLFIPTVETTLEDSVGPLPALTSTAAAGMRLTFHF